jgi:two-component system, LytTR family, sensor kinase
MKTEFHNTTRWREHEVLLVTILFLTAMAGNIWPLLKFPTEKLEEWQGVGFRNAHLSFNYYSNVLFPHAGVLLLFYVCYFWMNFYIMPRLVQAGAPAVGGFKVAFGRERIVAGGPGGVVIRRAVWGLLNVFLLLIVLSIGWGIAYTYTDTPFVAENLTGPMVVGYGLRQASEWVIGYIIYAFIREISIRRMQKDVLANASLISVVNQMSGFFVLYFTLGALLLNFDLMDMRGIMVFYFLVFPPAILAGVTNLYWIFPMKGDGSLFKGKVFQNLLLSTFCWGIPFMFFGVPDQHAFVPAVFFLWLGQLLLTTPLSWLIYRQRKDKILQMRGLQTALGQSEADLQFLRSQINPHFLFNVLNTLYGTALQEGASRTAGGIQRLGDMMRFMLHENHLNRIPMSKEIDYLKNYIALQELRTESSSEIVVDTIIDETFPEFMIAPMLLIPFVENGFKHGISLREPSWIKLRLHNEGDRILFEIRNSIHARKGEDPEKERSGIGLKNVLHRLKLLYPNRHEFYMHQDEREFFVQLTIQP